MSGPSGRKTIGGLMALIGLFAVLVTGCINAPFLTVNLAEFLAFERLVFFIHRRDVEDSLIKSMLISMSFAAGIVLLLYPLNRLVVDLIPALLADE